MAAKAPVEDRDTVVVMLTLLEVGITVVLLLCSMEAMATEAAATEDRSEAAECWWVGGSCLLGEAEESFMSGSKLAADEDVLEGFFFRLRFFVRLEAAWW